MLDKGFARRKSRIYGRVLDVYCILDSQSAVPTILIRNCGFYERESDELITREGIG